MGTWKRTWGRAFRGVAGAVLTLHAPATAPAADPEPNRASLDASSARIHVPDLATEWQLRQAIDGAHQWLADPGCQAVFTDFESLSGKLLSDVLAERGLTGQEHLGRLGFYDGSHYRQCCVPGRVFFTSPGYALIFVCPREFRRLARTPHEARATIIHEVLHTLGLGENPPASHEITERVLERCGSRAGTR
jgi:hypothetical protein